MNAEKTDPPRKVRWPALRRHKKVLALEQAGVNLMHFVWPVIGLVAISVIVWNAGQGFARKPRSIDIDYSKLFAGQARRLNDGRIEIAYDFSPRPDGFVEYPQLQDWQFQKGVYQGWLLGQASLRVAFTRQLDMEFDFRLLSGTNIMPAIGVRERGATRLAVLVESNGRASVWKFIRKNETRLVEMQTPLAFSPRETRRFRISAVTTYPPEGEKSPALLEAVTPPEIAVVVETPPYEPNHPPLPVAPEPPPEGPAPYTDISVSIDGVKLFEYRVERYVVDGWVMLDAWNSDVLFDNVKITGRLYPAWLANEVLIRRKIGVIKGN
ncbi:MAG TPA: hypothetical protein ENN09_00805 [Planctomycetes bacterium]|nr:hypothetical protein [Planctomycetota bacterium]